MTASVTRAARPAVKVAMTYQPRHLPIPAGEEGGLGPLEQTFEWLADGVALLADDGAVVYANRSFRAIARRNDGITTRKGKVDIAAAAARKEFERAIAGALHLQLGNATLSGTSDFPVDRSGDAARYLLSIRPIAGDERTDRAESHARVAVFVRDPSYRNIATIRILCDVLQLTEAEALLAQALQSGVRLQDHARARGISINTIYAHLRSVKQKADCHHMSELIRRLNDLQAAARGS
jgi:DNA-binding CsgD family transcriptional regulator